MITHPIRIAAVVLLTATALVACGSDPVSTAPVTEAPATGSITTPQATDPVSGPPATLPTDIPASDAPATDPPTSDAPAGDPAAAATLTIAEFAYSELNVAAGTEFTITNDDGFAHTVTDADDAFDVAVDGGASEPLTIADPGSYSIRCKIHPSMAGTITVE